jgi:hypothetical protein
MKNLKYSLTYCSLALLVFYSCVPLDNYDMPEETLKGTVYVAGTNKTESIQTEVSDQGVRIRMLEYSWSDNPQPFDFYAMQDGKYNNTKIFKGNYNICIAGPFVPLQQYDFNGNLVVDGSVTCDIKGTQEIDWEVEPFLKIEWVGEPVANAAKTKITASFRITRGTNNPNFQQNVTDIYLFINSSSYHVGQHNHDNRYSGRLQGNDAQAAFATGDVITLTTQGEFSPERDYYVRVGARINYQTEGQQRYNYNEPKMVKVLSN